MKVKAGKLSVCIKKLVRYGFSKAQAEIICGNIATKDADWVVKEKKEENKFTLKEPEEEVSKFETEVTGEELHVTAAKKKKKTTAAGGKAVKREKGKERPIVSEPRAMQLPLFQPWRAFKSEHRLQTKLEKIVTAEQKFLTMEQLMKRAEYALAIKKKDAAPLIVYAIPEEVWDQAVGMGKPLGTTKKGYPIVEWKRLAGGQAIPIVMTSKGAMPEAEAIKSGAKPGGGEAGGGPTITSILGKRAERRMEAKGKIPVLKPMTEKESLEEKGRSRDEALGVGLEELKKSTLEIKSPVQRYQEFKERQEREAKASIERKDPITPKQLAEQERFEKEVAYAETAPTFQIIGGNVMKEINFDKLRQEDLWAHIKTDLNWTVRGEGEKSEEEYDQLYMRIGKNPYTTSEVRNVVNQYEAIKRIKNTLILHDFIVHTKNYFLKELALKRLAEEDPSFFEEKIGDPSKPDKILKDPVRYGIKHTQNQRRDYKKQEKQYNTMKTQKEAYLSQTQKFFEEPRKGEKVPFNKPKTDKEVGKAHDPDAQYQMLEEMGLAKGGKITTERYAKKEDLAAEKKAEKFKKLIRPKK